jgi:general secretion pathway protein C
MAPQAGDRGAGQGIALIAVDGKPPRPFRVGATVEDSLVLQAVARRGATLGPAQGLAAVRLELPPLVTAATGSLPPAPSFTSTPTPQTEPQAEPQTAEPEFVPPPAPDPLAPDPLAPEQGDYSGLPAEAVDERGSRR